MAWTAQFLSLDVVARAIHEHPTLPWHIAMRLYPNEWVNAIKVLRNAIDNPCYGYLADLHHVHSVGYKSVSWFCSRVIGDEDPRQICRICSRSVLKGGGREHHSQLLPRS